MLKEEINPEFRNEFKRFIAECLHSCRYFISDIDECKTYDDLKRCLGRYSDEIAENVGHECDDHEEDINSLKSLYRMLEDEFDEHQRMTYQPQTYWGEEKMEIFKELAHNFTPAEFEAILVNALTK